MCSKHSPRIRLRRLPVDRTLTAPPSIIQVPRCIFDPVFHFPIQDAISSPVGEAGHAAIANLSGVPQGSIGCPVCDGAASGDPFGYSIVWRHLEKPVAATALVQLGSEATLSTDT